MFYIVLIRQIFSFIHKNVIHKLILNTLVTGLLRSWKFTLSMMLLMWATPVAFYKVSGWFSEAFASKMLSIFDFAKYSSTDSYFLLAFSVFFMIHLAYVIKKVKRMETLYTLFKMSIGVGIAIYSTEIINLMIH